MWDDDDDRRVLIVPTVTVSPAAPAPLCTSCGRRILPSGMCGCNDR